VPHTTAAVLRQKVPEQSCDHRRLADPAKGRAAPVPAFRRLEAARTCGAASWALSGLRPAQIEGSLWAPSVASVPCPPTVCPRASKSWPRGRPCSGTFCRRTTVVVCGTVSVRHDRPERRRIRRARRPRRRERPTRPSTCRDAGRRSGRRLVGARHHRNGSRARRRS
jgi:hypothetical protein